MQKKKNPMCYSSFSFLKSYCTLLSCSLPIKKIFLTPPLFKLFFCPLFHFSRFLSLSSFHFLLCSPKTPLLSRNSSALPKLHSQHRFPTVLLLRNFSALPSVMPRSTWVLPISVVPFNHLIKNE